MDPSAHCMVSSDDVRLNEECYEAAKIIKSYIQHGKINYKVYFFSYYTINNTYISSGLLRPMFILGYDK
jgi:hypothetical protein